MKKIGIITIAFFTMMIGYSQNNEKKIKFNNGVLKICSSSNMKITGYDGDEVIIKNKNNVFYRTVSGTFSGTKGVPVNVVNGSLSLGTTKNIKKGKSVNIKNSKKLYGVASSNNDSVNTGSFYYKLLNDNKNLEKGLKPLGNKSTNPADNLYLQIEQNAGELIIKDYESGSGSFVSGNQYELLIPNSIKLLWNTENCTKTKSNTFFVTSKPWELSNFKGEVEMSSSYGSITLTDVSGPVIANTIGGNIKVVFDKTSPNNLYSLISNDGYIDIQLPKNSNLNIDAKGDRILSDIDFEILNDDIVGGVKEMRLQLNSGNVKMKLNSGSGTIYLREK